MMPFSVMPVIRALAIIEAVVVVSIMISVVIPVIIVMMVVLPVVITLIVFAIVVFAIVVMIHGGTGRFLGLPQQIMGFQGIRGHRFNPHQLHFILL